RRPQRHRSRPQNGSRSGLRLAAISPSFNHPAARRERINSMEFLVILIVWALITNVELPMGLHRDEWLVAWRVRASEALGMLSPIGRLLVVCALPCLLVAALEWLLSPRWAGIPLFVLELAVLLYSIGRSDFR